jgi:hypothetical protein
MQEMSLRFVSTKMLNPNDRDTIIQIKGSGPGQGCHTGRPKAFWRANRAGGRAALSITPYMNRAGYCRQRNYCSKFTLL